MDRNQVTGMVLFALLFVVYFTFFSPEPPAEGETPAQTEAVAESQAQSPANRNEVLTEAGTPGDSARQAALASQYGVFAPAINGTAQEVVLENEDLQIIFDSKGARIKRVWLKEFRTYSQEPLYLLTEESSQMELIAQTGNGPIDLKELYYEPKLESLQIDGLPAQRLRFSLNLAGGRTITHSYVLPADGYQLAYNLQTSGLNEFGNAPLTYRWNNRMPNFEHDIKDSRAKSTLNYYTVEEDYEELDRTGADEAEEINIGVKWVGMNHRFFTASIIANGWFESGRIKATFSESDTVNMKNAQVELAIPSQELEKGAEFKYYFGPNNYAVLNDVADGFEQNVNLGYFFLRPINKWIIIPTFHFLERFFDNYGIIILLLVIFIKTLLFPLTYKSYVSMAKTRVLKPQIDEIKEKYGDDMAKVQQEQMKLYSQLGINPISGCVPMLLQMPILFAMFYFFPNSIELRQESFLWAEDLSTYDSVLTLPFEIPFYGDHVSLFTLLMTASTILMTMTNQQMSTVQGPMKTISYIMPVTFLFFLNSFPAGLTYYYFLSNIITFGQQAAIRRFVDDDKIKETLEKNRLKNKDKKVSGFQARLQEALKASQEAKKENEGRKARKK